MLQLPGALRAARGVLLRARLLCVIADLLLGRAATGRFGPRGGGYAARQRAAFARVTLGAVATDATDRARARTAAWAAVLGAWVVALEVYRAVARGTAPTATRGWAGCCAATRTGRAPRRILYPYNICRRRCATRWRSRPTSRRSSPARSPVRLVVPEDERRGRCDAFFARLTERLRGRREGLREGLLEGDGDDEDRGGVDAHLPFLCEELYLGQRPAEPVDGLRHVLYASGDRGVFGEALGARSRSSRPRRRGPATSSGPTRRRRSARGG